MCSFSIFLDHVHTSSPIVFRILLHLLYFVYFFTYCISYTSSPIVFRILLHLLYFVYFFTYCIVFLTYLLGDGSVGSISPVSSPIVIGDFTWVLLLISSSCIVTKMKRRKNNTRNCRLIKIQNRIYLGKTRRICAYFHHLSYPIFGCYRHYFICAKLTNINYVVFRTNILYRYRCPAILYCFFSLLPTEIKI